MRGAAGGSRRLTWHTRRLSRPRRSERCFGFARPSKCGRSNSQPGADLRENPALRHATGANRAAAGGATRTPCARPPAGDRSSRTHRMGRCRRHDEPAQCGAPRGPSPTAQKSCGFMPSAGSSRGRATFIASLLGAGTEGLAEGMDDFRRDEAVHCAQKSGLEGSGASRARTSASAAHLRVVTWHIACTVESNRPRQRSVYHGCR